MKDNLKTKTQKIDQINPNLQFLANNIGNNGKFNVAPVSLNPQDGQNANSPVNFQNFMNVSNLSANFQTMINPNQMLGNLNLMGMNGLNGLNPM